LEASVSDDALGVMLVPVWPAVGGFPFVPFAAAGGVGTLSVVANAKELPIARTAVVAAARRAIDRFPFRRLKLKRIIASSLFVSLLAPASRCPSFWASQRRVRTGLESRDRADS
jgi:hypothetical protein